MGGALVKFANSDTPEMAGDVVAKVLKLLEYTQPECEPPQRIGRIAG
jgi:hypothetical protein